MNTEQLRTEFEAWYEKQTGEAPKISENIYTPFATACWEAFQAGRATLHAENDRLRDALREALTDEHKAILKECRNQAMIWTLNARIPEAGAFGGIAQDLDYLCEQLVIKND